MENDDVSILCGLLLCLMIAIVGLYLGSVSVPTDDLGVQSARWSSETGQVLVKE